MFLGLFTVKTAQRSNTTTKMLSMFRQMEEAERTMQYTDSGPKPLKCFTPPPDDNRRYENRNSESENDLTDSEEDDEEEDDEADNDAIKANRNIDEELQQAQAAARAKHLRAKFERWESKEIQREQNIQLFDGDDQSQTESAKT